MTKRLRDYALSLNREQSALYTAPDAQLARRRYFAQHPTKLIALKCMDGRLNLSLITKTPPGTIKPYRNIGGRFDLGWPFLGELIHDDIELAVKEGHDTLVFVTYHFAKGDEHRGCAGFGYDTAAAKAATERLRDQFEEVYGTGHKVVYPIVVGIETDEDSLVLHGKDGEPLQVADILNASTEEVERELLRLYSDMAEEMRRNLVPLVLGNQEHIRELRASGREPVELEHKENIIGVGRGFYWLHEPNKALIIGPYGHEWVGAVETAGKIVKGNFDAGRISPEDGVLLLVSSLARSRKGSAGWNTAVEKARYLARTAEAALREKYPEFALDVLVGVVDEHTLLFHPVED